MLVIVTDTDRKYNYKASFIRYVYLTYDTHILRVWEVCLKQ